MGKIETDVEHNGVTMHVGKELTSTRQLLVMGIKTDKCKQGALSK